MSSAVSTRQEHVYQVCFPPYIYRPRAVSFPCNARGEVDLNGLSEAGRRDYLFGRVMMRLRCLDPLVVEVPVGHVRGNSIATHSAR